MPNVDRDAPIVTCYDEAAELVARFRKYAACEPEFMDLPAEFSDAADLIERLAKRELVGYIVMRNGEYLVNRPQDFTMATYTVNFVHAQMWRDAAEATKFAKNAGGTVRRVWIEKGDGDSE